MAMLLRTPKTSHLWHRRPVGGNRGETPVPQAYSGTFRRILVFVSAVLLSALPAVAQVNADVLDPENIQPLDPAQPTLAYVCGGLFLLAAMAVGFKPSKRTRDE